MDPITGGLLIGGTILGAIGQSKAAKAQARAARAQAAAKREQADEMLKRAKFNAAVMREQGRGLQQQQIAAYAKSGVALSSGSTLATLQDTASNVNLGIQQMLDEADFKANQLRMGADIDTRLAGDIRSAGKWAVAGTLLSGAGRVGAAGGFSGFGGSSSAAKVTGGKSVAYNYTGPSYGNIA